MRRGIHLLNANSGTYLEIASASTADENDAVQWSPTGCACQQRRRVKEGAQ